MPIFRGTPTTYDVPSNARDISKVYYALTNPDSPFYDRVLIGDSVRATTLEWWEDVALPTATKVKEAVTSATTTFKFEDVGGLRQGDVFEINNTAYRVTAKPNYVANSVEATPITASKPSNAAVGDIVSFMNGAELEGGKPVDGYTVFRKQRENYTQIMKGFVSVTGSQQAVDQEIPIADMIADELARTMSAMYAKMSRAIWYNPKVKAEDNETARMFGGVYQLIDEYSQTYSMQFTRANIDTWLLEANRELRNPCTEMWMNPVDLDRFEGLITNPQTILMPDGSDVKVGNTPTVYVSKRGFKVNLYTDVNCKPGRLFLGSPSNIKLRPLRGRQFQVKDFDDGSDNIQKQIIGEYTLEYNPVSRDTYLDIVD